MYLQRLSGFFFYLLGASVFVAWILLRNKIEPTASAIWLQTVDLPLAFSAVVYGGLSLFLSLRSPGKSSNVLPWMITVPLALFFALIVVMNFWN